MDVKKIERYLAWAAIFVLGSIAVTLGSFPVLFRHIFALGFALCLVGVRLIPPLKIYSRVLDALFVFVFIWYLPYLSLYKKFILLGKDVFYWIFKESDAVSHVADNSLSGLFWIFLPLVLVFLEKDSLKTIFLKKGKTAGWIIGGIFLILLVAAALVIALSTALDFNLYLSLFPLGLTFAVINAFKEEILYRGLIFGRTIRFGFVYALICQFVWFSLIHLLYSGAGQKSFGMIIGVGVFSLFSAWMTKRYDSVACPVMVHTGIDFIIFIASVPQYVNQ